MLGLLGDFNSGGDDPIGLLAMQLLNNGGGQINPLVMLASLLDKNPSSTNTAQNTAPQETPPTYNNFSQPTTTLSSPDNNTAPGDPVSRLAMAIKKYESGNRYSALGPTTNAGDRAHGAYQIMGNNIPQWSREALGHSITKQEFLQNPALQDAIAQAKIAQYYNQYGNPQDVASMWFSGRPLRNNQSRDILGTSVPKYAKDVASIFYGS